MAAEAAAPSKVVLVWSPRSELVNTLKGSLRAGELRGVRVGPSLAGALEEVRASAVIVDASSSASEALSACAALEKGGKLQVPVLLILAPGDVETLERGMRMGISDFAEEPCSPGVLVARIRGLLKETKPLAQIRLKPARTDADRDGLTGLRNRSSFTERLEQVLEQARIHGHQAALLYLDMDRFKAINDALGHSVGDGFLQQVARVLENQLRPTDIVAGSTGPAEGDVSRLGGDEFTILLSKVEQAQNAGEVAHRILEALRVPVDVSGYTLSSTASLGISIFPDDGDDGETLLRCADMAMYDAKSQGRGLYRFYQPSMGNVYRRRLEIEQNLRHALDKGELDVHYQPRIDLANDAVCSVEALARWNSPKLGAISPSEFIPVAEESGLIVPIGAWVLETACAQAARWREEGLGALKLSVNVSSQQLASADFVRVVTDALRRYEVDPQLLELEVTERLMLGIDETTALGLRDLRAIGVTWALDDFGTGYSSLSCIAECPLDVLKIDRSIASKVEDDPTAVSIVSAVVTLGRELGMEVVAEGVDRPGQARILRELGCDELQGYLASPPLAASEVPDFCRGWKGLERPEPQDDREPREPAS